MLHWGAERCAPQDEPRQKGLCVRTRECVHAGGVWLSEAVGRKWRSGAAVEPGESSQGVAVEMACGAQLGARCGALFLGAENRGRLRRGRTGLYVFTRRRGANTAHIQMGRPTHEAPTREYTHKHTQTQDRSDKSYKHKTKTRPPPCARLRAHNRNNISTLSRAVDPQTPSQGAQRPVPAGYSRRLAGATCGRDLSSGASPSAGQARQDAPRRRRRAARPCRGEAAA